MRCLHRQGRVAVPDLHPVQPQPFALQLVIAVAELGIGGDDGVAQRLDHLGLHMVGQVPPGLRRWHAAPAVEDFFFFGLRVVHAGKGFDVVLQRRGPARARPPRAWRGPGRSAGSACLRCSALAINVEGQPCDGFVKQPLPRVADDAQIMQEFLQLVRQLVGLHRADAVEDGLVAGQIGVFGERPFRWSSSMRLISSVKNTSGVVKW